MLHLDLKPENILISCDDFLSPECAVVNLIDYGLSLCYQNPDKTHIVKNKKMNFRGNILFASKNAFKSKSQSRRDDIISTFYLLLYNVEGGSYWLEQHFESKNNDFYRNIE